MAKGQNSSPELTMGKGLFVEGIIGIKRRGGSCCCRGVRGGEGREIEDSGLSKLSERDGGMWTALVRNWLKFT